MSESVQGRVAIHRYLPQVGCAAGAMLAVGVGTAAFGGGGLSAALGVVLGSLWHAISAAAGWAGALLSRAPWTLVIDATVGTCLYFLCRMIRAGAHRRAYLVSLAVTTALYVLYLCTALAWDADYLASVFKALVVSAVLTIPASMWAAQCKPDMGRTEEWWWGWHWLLTVVGVVVGVVVAINWFLDTRDTLPNVSAEVQAKYGAELARMGFEDVDREGMTMDFNTCASLDIQFREGNASVEPGPISTDVFYGVQGDTATSCVAMRMRNGKLTMIFPDRKRNVSRADTEKAAMAAADALMGQIRSAYAVVEQHHAANETWRSDGGA